ncbi:UDP-N-acetyl glucosamine 2-epimerase [Deltaproteobacteria bacterium IMCC39524]|nr:UDP-N-acetyl glucosamine 2-epimerase [Deltaproteobacteria bacterium IMCC39524]
MKKIIVVVGNRPQFIKAAIVNKLWKKSGLDKKINTYFVHTGQHYDKMLSDVFFEQLGLSDPDVNLQMGSGAIVDQIGAMLPKLRHIMEEQAPDAVMVYGDTNSTIAAALVASHLHIPLFHVEAGERNYRRNLAPEEVNRIVTDELAWKCLTSTEKAYRYLMREGYNPERVRWVGDPMYDLFCWGKKQIESGSYAKPSDFGITGDYILATIHRNENTAEFRRLDEILRALDNADIDVVLPLHPRVRNILKEKNWEPSGSLKLIEPLGYFDILSMLDACSLCFTDSGGLAREAFFGGRPAIVPLPNSGWNEIVESGWCKVIPGGESDILSALENFKIPLGKPVGLFGDGEASIKIGNEILSTLEGITSEGAWHPSGMFQALPQPEDRSMFAYDYLEEFLAQSSQRWAHMSIACIADYDVESSHQLASVLLENNRTCTFFFDVDSSFYNLATEDNINSIKNIRIMKHNVGLRVKLDENSDSEIWASKIYENKVDIFEKIFSYRPDSILVEGPGGKSFLEFSGGRFTDEATETFEYPEKISTNGRNFLILFRSHLWAEEPKSDFEARQIISDAISMKARKRLNLLL